MQETAHIVLTHRERVLRLREAQPEAMLDQLVHGPRSWVSEDLSSRQWTVKLTEPALSEILGMVEQMRQAPLPLLLRHPDHFNLEACRLVMARLKQILKTSIGLAVLEKLPMDQMSEEEAIAVFWVLGFLISQPVATKWNGTMLYHVRDTGQSFGYGVRGSATNVELSFHTDNAFGISLPEYVGLLCINSAMIGGVSRFCSLYTVHNELLRSYPHLLRRLYQASYYDRQAEHATTAPKVLSASLFRYEGGRLLARLTPGLIRRGYEMMGERMDQTLIEALECLEEILNRRDLWVDFTLEPGQIQYLDNHWCAHFRSAYIDSDDAAHKRHLVRAWYRDQGRPTYDG